MFSGLWYAYCSIDLVLALLIGKGKEIFYDKGNYHLFTIAHIRNQITDISIVNKCLFRLP